MGEKQKSNEWIKTDIRWKRMDKNRYLVEGNIVMDKIIILHHSATFCIHLMKYTEP